MPGMQANHSTHNHMTTQYQPKTDAKCSCKRGMERDNCPQCEGTGWRIDFAAIRNRNKPNFSDIITRFDSDHYDISAMEIDAQHGNFSPENAEEYRHENIVQASLINGQFSQAQIQCSQYGLCYESEYAKFKHGDE